MSKHALISNLIQKCIYNNYKNVLSIGTYSFPLATTKVRLVPQYPFKFADKYFDFTYSYDIFDNIKNPELLGKEMNRISKEGIIETFSPLKSILLSHKNTEYIKWKVNKDYITWTDYHTNTLCFMFLKQEYDCDSILITISDNIKNKSQIFYHNFYTWNSNNPIKVKIYTYNNRDEYIKLLKEASYKSICNTELMMNIF